MPRSDWNILAPLAGLAALFTAFALGAYVTALDNPEQGYPRYSDAREKGQEANAAGSVNLANPVQYRTPCANPQRESESDLCAQWRAANAAEQSALWTKLGFWAGLFGLFGLYWQVILTRRAVEDTGDATKAMQDANDIARETGIAQSRAYLHIEDVWIQVKDANDPLAILKVRNSGQSPAKNVEIVVGVKFVRAEGKQSQIPTTADQFVLRRCQELAIGANTHREISVPFAIFDIDAPSPDFLVGVIWAEVRYLTEYSSVPPQSDAVRATIITEHFPRKAGEKFESFEIEAVQSTANSDTRHHAKG